MLRIAVPNKGSLAETAALQNYTKPLMHAGDELAATGAAEESD